MLKAGNIAIKKHKPSRDYMEKAAEKAFTAVKQAAEMERQLFAERLKTLRKNAGLTQLQLADKSGVDRVLINRYENGAAMPRPKTIEALAAALNVEMDLFFPESVPVLFDIDVLKRNGVNVSYDKITGVYKLSVPGLPELKTTDIDMINWLWEYSEQNAEKILRPVKEKLITETFTRNLYTEFEKVTKK